MVFKGCISPKICSYVKYHSKDLRRYGSNNACIIRRLAKECKISERTVYRLLNEPITYDAKSHEGSSGRKRKVSVRAEKWMMRNICKIRASNKNCVVRELMHLTDIKNISMRTAHRILNRNGYNYLVARKKGVISHADVKTRLKFAKIWIQKDATFWKEDIAFYFDGVGFVHKTSPKEAASSCRGKVWRKPTEGLHMNCTAKGAKEGYEGKQAFVAISHNRGVILAEQYDKLNGETFANFIRSRFEDAFLRSNKNGRQWIQDGDPSQNSAKAKTALQEVGANLFPIPPRSPELNPIENVFSFVKKELNAQVLESNIEKESYKQFSLRVKATLYSSSI